MWIADGVIQNPHLVLAIYLQPLISFSQSIMTHSKDPSAIWRWQRYGEPIIAQSNILLTHIEYCFTLYFIIYFRLKILLLFHRITYISRILHYIILQAGCITVWYWRGRGGGHQYFITIMTCQPGRMSTYTRDISIIATSIHTLFSLTTY